MIKLIEIPLGKIITLVENFKSRLSMRCIHVRFLRCAWLFLDTFMEKNWWLSSKEHWSIDLYLIVYWYAAQRPCLIWQIQRNSHLWEPHISQNSGNMIILHGPNSDIIEMLSYYISIWPSKNWGTYWYSHLYAKRWLIELKTH